MTVQYKRSYSLIINDNEKIRTLTELKIEFEVTKSLRGFPNQAKIKIYNPSPDTESTLRNNDVLLTLNAGYENAVDLLFTGQLRNVTQERQGVDRIITVFAADGRKDWETSFYNKTLSDKITIKQTIEELAATFVSTATGVLLGLEAKADKLRGQTLSGKTSDLLDQLAEDYDFEWSIQDGSFVTVPITEAIDKNDIIVLTSNTGMIGTPTITREGVTVKALLNPRITPNRLIQIKSEGTIVSLGNLFFENVRSTTADGIYKVYELIHKGDSRGTDWFTEAKGIVFNNV